MEPQGTIAHVSSLTEDARAAMINAMIRNKEETAFPAEADVRVFELQADICKTLANPKRLQIVNLLKQGEISVGAMVKAMGIAKAKRQRPGRGSQGQQGPLRRGPVGTSRCDGSYGTPL